MAKTIENAGGDEVNSPEDPKGPEETRTNYDPEIVDKSTGESVSKLKQMQDKVAKGELKPEFPSANIDKKKSSDSTKHKDENQTLSLWEMVNRMGYFFLDKTENTYYVPKGERPIEVNSRLFEAKVSKMFLEQENKIPNGQAINKIQILSLIEAGKRIIDVGVRVGKIGNEMVYDPLNDDNSVYHIASSGCRLEIPELPCTVRFKGMLHARVENGEKEDLDKLLDLWNLTEDQRMLLSVDIAVAFVPGIPQVIDVMGGEQGTGKTTLTKAIKLIVDPNTADSISLRTDNEKDLMLALLHQYMVLFDNVNQVMPNWLSDRLCSAATGNGFRSRELFTDFGEFIAVIIRKIVMNGIGRSNYNGDFIERSTHYNIQPMDDNVRKTDEEMKAAISVLSPKIRGFILSIFPKAIALYNETKVQLKDQLPRMADYALWGECFSRTMGYNEGTFLKAFKKAQGEEVLMVFSEDPVVQGIIKLVEFDELGLGENKDSSWEGSSTNLLNALREAINPADAKLLPKNGNALGKRLVQIGPALRKMGIEIETDHGKKRITKKSIESKSSKNNPRGDYLIGSKQNPQIRGLAGEASKSSKSSSINDSGEKNNRIKEELGL